MGFFSFILSLILALVGIALSGFLLWQVLSPLLGLSSKSFSSSKGGLFQGRSFGFGSALFLKKASRRLQKVDFLLKNDKVKEALRDLRKAVVYKSPGNDKKVRELREHNQNILSRYLVAAEQLGTRAENIAAVERLFIQRSELHSLLLKVQSSYSKFQEKRRMTGKDTPDWSKNEFKNRHLEVKKELKENKQQLEQELKKLEEAITTSRPDNIVYH